MCLEHKIKSLKLSSLSAVLFLLMKNSLIFGFGIAALALPYLAAGAVQSRVSQSSSDKTTVLSAVSNTSPMSCLSIPDLSTLNGCTLYAPDPDFDPTGAGFPPFQIMTGDREYVIQASMKSDGMPFFLISPEDPNSNPFLQIFYYDPSDKTIHLAIDSTFLLSLTSASVLNLVQQPLIQPDTFQQAKDSVSHGGRLTPCNLAVPANLPIIQKVSVPPLVFFASANGTVIASLEEDASLAYDGAHELGIIPYRSCICKGLVIGGQLWQLAPVVCGQQEAVSCSCD